MAMKWIKVMLFLSVTAISMSPVTSLRLVDGSNACEGRLEETDGVQACNLNTGNNEAQVVCRELGCNPSGAQRVDARDFGFSAAINSYRAFSFQCNGNERSLSACSTTGAVCTSDSAPHAIAIRCGAEIFRVHVLLLLCLLLIAIYILY